MDFTNQVALITGAAVGIGRATALEIARMGGSLVLLDMNLEKLNELETELRPFGQTVLCYHCDISNEEEVINTVQDALQKVEKIDILVNNAAIWRDRGSFLEISSEEWKRYFDINVLGTMNVTRAALPGMLERQYGRIINVASVAGVYGNAKMSHYSATKGAIIAFTKALAKEVSDKGVLVNAVSPGSVSPSAQADIDYTQPSELSFMGRTGSGRENANLICFLASKEAGYIAGQNIQIDGCRKKQ